MLSISEILASEFELLKSELIAQYDALGMRASGRWAESLSAETTENSAKLYAADYTHNLENGRNPGKQPPSEAIEQWIKDKGIAARLENGMSVSSLAFLIARKIGREGWNRQQYGGTQLVSSVITPQRMQHIIDRAGEAHLNNILTELTNFLKQTL